MEEEVVKSPAELAADAKAADEARRAAQVDFDPKLHGVGTHPAVGPASVTALHQMHVDLVAYVQSLEARIKALEG